MSKQALQDWELEERFEAMLDDIYGTVSVCGYEYSAGRALRELDPTAFRCGLADWLDDKLSNGTLFERDGEYFDEEPEEEEQEEVES